MDQAMAHNASAKKRIRQTSRRTEINRANLSRLRTFLRKVEMAIASGDKTAAQDAFRLAQPELMKSRQKGIVHRNLVARKLTRFTSRIKAMAT
jgi:small subunit ribosomal protein S20